MPVLFVPGNAGSFKQVRSIASSAAHQFHERIAVQGLRTDDEEGLIDPAKWKELDFFAGKHLATVRKSRCSSSASLYHTADFNEEFSAFQSATLEDQSLYVACAIQYILDLYPVHNPASQSIILVGHSMGGIVCRHAVTRMEISQVSAIITMSTPHLIPPVTFERGMQAAYDRIEAFWHSAWYENRPAELSAKTSSPPPILVSICGGTADTQISSDSCALQPLEIKAANTPVPIANSTDKGTFAVFTTGMEGIWTGVDHQAMVWCDQVRQTVATTLLDLSAVSHNHSPAGGNTSRQKLTQVARRRFLGERYPQKLQKTAHDRVMINLQDALILTAESPTFRHQGPGSALLVANVPDNATHLQIIGDMRVNGAGRIGGSDMTIYLKTWSLDDPAQTTFRELPLKVSRILPKSTPHKEPLSRELFPLPGEGVKDEDCMLYVEVKLEYPLSSEKQIVIELSDTAKGAIALLEPDIATSAENKWKPILQLHTYKSVSDNALILHELQLHRPARCTGSASTLFAPIIEHVSHANSATYESRLYPQAGETITIHTHTSAAPFIKELSSDGKSRGITINLWQDPADGCGIQGVTIRTDWRRSLGLMVARYRMTFLAWTIGTASLVTMIQFRHYRLTGELFTILRRYEFSGGFAYATGDFLSFFQALVVFTGRPLAILFAALAVACFVQSAILPMLTSHAEDFLLGVPHWYSALWVLPVLSICYGVLIAINSVLYALTFLLRVGLGWTGILRFPRSLDAQQHFQPRHAVSVIALVILVKLLVPHQLAFTVGFIVHLLSTSTAEIGESSNMSRLNLYRTLLMSLFMLVPANAAVLFVWIRNLLVLLDKPSGSSSRSSYSTVRSSSGIPESTLLAERDHAIWQIVAVLVVVEACSAGKMPEMSVR
ncbi:hypothetical protein QFC19_002918 [Naganishia cerealis]|uniref:Uncharacterized protein n=1 Tax=Naganishia cerealis TaxID=610337 RepID=A0ACC2W5P4_9TREE|nr:hypothetical protein QFC19_002918 [Naganishia cerealis]